MKKFLLIICTFLIIFISCSSENKALEKDRIITDKPEIEYTEDDMDTAFGRAVLLTIKASLDSAEILQRNGLEYSTGTGKGLNEEGIYFSELISYMPKGKDGEEIDSKVLNELSEVESEYNESINNLVPDYDEVKGAGLLNIDEETGEIIVSDCEKIALNSIEGIALVEVNNMVANGMTTEEAVEYVQRDIEKVLSSITEESKGIYIPANTTNLGFIRGGKWDKGVVKYYFDNRNRLSDEGKKIVLEAMKEWTDKTGGVIKFEEIAHSFWGQIASGLFQYPYLRISKKDLKVSDKGIVTGQSSVGSYSHGISHIDLNENGINSYFSSNNKEVFKQTALHEIGHTLGLSHEHQRPDRDEYIFVPDGDRTNYGKIPDKQVFFGVKVIKIWFLRIYIPYMWYGTFGKTVGSFDFDSIMLYEGFSIKPKYVDIDKGIYSTKSNYTLSETDIRTIKEMYK